MFRIRKVEVCEADHSLAPGAEVKNGEGYACAPTYVFVAWCLVN
jgi:hypothetical protein